jgi:hypothetical protein
MPDDSDRRLAARLRAYESRVPSDEPPPLNSVRRGLPRSALISTGALGALAAGLLALVVLQQSPEPFGESSPSPTPSAMLTPTPSPSATSPATLAPSVTPTTRPPTATAAPVPAEWTLANTFAEPNRPTFVFDATAWERGFVAVGARLDGFAGDVGPYAGQPILWISADGSSWEERALDIEIPVEQPGAPVDARVGHVVTLPDGRLMVIRSVYAAATAWTSLDASTWTPVDLGIGDTSVLDIDRGPTGLVLIGTSAEGLEQIWFSTDGLQWELTREDPAADAAQLSSVAAGPEGFVVVGAHRTDTDRPYVLASADGRTWLEAPLQAAFEDDDFPYDVAPLGPDWIATGFGAEQADQRTVVWRSANGLDWERDLGPVDPSGRDSYYATDIAGAGGLAVLSPAEARIGGPFQFPTLAWSTIDGVDWTGILPDGSYVTDLITDGTTVVAVGTIGRGDSAAFWIRRTP